MVDRRVGVADEAGVGADEVAVAVRRGKGRAKALPLRGEERADAATDQSTSARRVIVTAASTISLTRCGKRCA